MGEARRFSCLANWIHDKWTLLAQIQINSMIFQCLMSIYLGSWVFSFLLEGGEEFYGWQLCSFPPQWPPQCLLYHGKRLRVNFPTWGIRPQNGEENDQYVKPGLKCELEDPNYHSEELTILLRFGGFFSSVSSSTCHMVLSPSRGSSTSLSSSPIPDHRRGSCLSHKPFLQAHRAKY